MSYALSSIFSPEAFDFFYLQSLLCFADKQSSLLSTDFFLNQASLPHSLQSIKPFNIICFLCRFFMLNYFNTLSPLSNIRTNKYL